MSLNDLSKEELIKMVTDLQEQVDALLTRLPTTGTPGSIHC